MPVSSHGASFRGITLDMLQNSSFPLEIEGLAGLLPQSFPLSRYGMGSSGRLLKEGYGHLRMVRVGCNMSACLIQRLLRAGLMFSPIICYFLLFLCSFIGKNLSNLLYISFFLKRFFWSSNKGNYKDPHLFCYTNDMFCTWIHICSTSGHVYPIFSLFSLSKYLYRSISEGN